MWEQVCCEPHSPVQLVAESKVGRFRDRNTVRFCPRYRRPQGPSATRGGGGSHIHGPRVPSGPRARTAAFGRAGRGREEEEETEMRGLKKKIRNKLKPNPTHTTVNKQ